MLCIICWDTSDATINKRLNLRIGFNVHPFGHLWEVKRQSQTHMHNVVPYSLAINERKVLFYKLADKYTDLIQSKTHLFASRITFNGKANAS